MYVLRRRTCSAEETAWRKNLNVRVSWTMRTRRRGIAEEYAENCTPRLELLSKSFLIGFDKNYVSRWSKFVVTESCSDQARGLD
jgi:hypothetical protein